MGKLFYFYNGWLQNTKEVIHNNQDEGPILVVNCYYDVVSWATPKNIRVIHYGKKQKICLIERPKNSPHFAEYIYESKVVKPTIFWKKEEQDKTDLLYLSWYNLIKICRLKLKQEDQKFQMEVIKSIDLDNIFICGLSLIKEFMVLFQFTLPKKDNQNQENTSNQDKIPEMCIYKSQTEILMKDQLNGFDNIFTEIFYQQVASLKCDGNSFVYNPDMIMKVQPITIIDRIEYLIQKKKFEETLQLIEQQKDQIPAEEILKFQNIYLEHLIKTKDNEKVGKLLPLFLGIKFLNQILSLDDNKERWEHWISRLMQKKIIGKLLQIIPKEYPRLDLKIYTKIFEHLLEIKDYINVQLALKTFPHYLINQFHLMEVLKKQIELQKELSNNKEVLEILFLLYDLNRDYLTAFHIIVKMKDKKVFDFLRRVQLDFDLGNYLSKLLQIDSSMTVDYLFSRYGKNQQTQIVEQCVNIIKQMERQDKDKLLYLFLDEVFTKSPELSKDFHAQQIDLYCRFNPAKLMLFLQKTEDYSPQTAVETCQQYDLFKEQAYLLMKIGNEPEAIRVLIDKCHKVSEIIEISVKFNINIDNLWDQILLKSLHNTEQINSLLHYVDQYSKPSSILSLYGEDVRIGEVRDSLIIAFRKLRLYKFLLRASLHVCQKSKQEVLLCQINQNQQGYFDIDNECDQCKKSLLTQKVLNDYSETVQQKQSHILDLFQQFTNSISNTSVEEAKKNQQYNQEAHQNLLKAFMIFRCGHKFHKKCMVAKKQLENEEQQVSKLQLSKQPFERKNKQRQGSNFRSSNSSNSSKNRLTNQSNSVYECLVCSKFNFLIDQ